MTELKGGPDERPKKNPESNDRADSTISRAVKSITGKVSRLFRLKPEKPREDEEVTNVEPSIETNLINDPNAYTYRNVSDKLGFKSKDYKIGDPEFRRVLFAKINNVFSDLKSTYIKMDNRYPLASLCLRVLERLSLRDDYYYSEKEIDKHVFSVVKIAMYGVSIPPEAFDEVLRTSQFRDWENAYGDNKASMAENYLQGMLHSSLERYLKIKEREGNESRSISRDVVRPNLEAQILPQEPKNLQQFLHNRAVVRSVSPYKPVSISDFIPPDTHVDQTKLDALSVMIPAGMEPIMLFSTSSFLIGLFDTYERNVGDLSKVKIGDLLNSVIPENIHGMYFHIPNVMSYVKDPETGEYNKMANCIKNTLIWAPFHMDQMYENWTKSDSDRYSNTYHPDKDKGDFEEASAAVNEQQLVTLMLIINQLCSGASSLEEIFKKIAPDISIHHFVKMARNDKPVLLERLKKLLEVAQKVCSDARLVKFFEGFVGTLEKFPLNEWDLPLKESGVSIREKLRLLARGVFYTDRDKNSDQYKKGVKRQEWYRDIARDQVNKWGILNDQGSEVKPQSHQLARRAVGFRMNVRDVVVNTLYELMELAGLNVETLIKTRDHASIVPVLKELYEDPKSKDKLILLMKRANGALKVLYYEHWNSKKA